MRSVLLLILLFAGDSFALSVDCSRIPPDEDRGNNRTLWIQVVSGCRDVQLRAVPARVVARVDEAMLVIESRQPVMVNGEMRTAILRAHVREQDILPGNRILSVMMQHTTVAYSELPLTANPHWFSRLLSWIF